ncbi:MAG: hypothetical protein JWO82_3404 [Akkermansiaceae bacterium]|nr:hypothetical protein [Akkermansiaceae bacterium]
MFASISRPSPAKILNHLIWVLPVLAGTGSYYSTVAGAPDKDRQTMAGARPEESREPRSGDAGATLEALIERQRQVAKQSAQAIPTLDGKALRERLLVLKGESVQSGQSQKKWAIYQETKTLTEELARREGAAGIAWLEANFPAVRLPAMEAWAKENPQAAFDYVTRSTVNSPCTCQTLIALLNAKADAGPETLKAAAAQVPWHLFHPEPDNGSMARDYFWFVGTSGQHQTWLASGLPRSLAEQGIVLEGVLPCWFEIDPPRALQEWSTWPRQTFDQAAYDLCSMLGPRDCTSLPDFDGLNETLRKADPPVLARIVEVFGYIARKDREIGNVYRANFPGLVPEIAPEESHADSAEEAGDLQPDEPGETPPEDPAGE